jgi:hypothetical protein
LPFTFNLTPSRIFKCLMCLACATSAQHLQAQSCLAPSALLGSSQPVVLYVWSPRMVQSVLQAPNAKLAADKSGASFVTALDPRVPQSEVDAALRATSPDIQAVLKNSRPLCEDALEHALDHAPTLFIIAQQHVHKHRIIGVMSAREWRKAITLRLNELASR